MIIPCGLWGADKKCSGTLEEWQKTIIQTMFTIAASGPCLPAPEDCACWLKQLKVFRSPGVSMQALEPIIARCVTLGNSLIFFELQFPHQCNNNSYFTRLLWKLEKMFIKQTWQSLPHVTSIDLCVCKFYDHPVAHKINAIIISMSQSANRGWVKSLRAVHVMRRGRTWIQIPLVQGLWVQSSLLLPQWIHSNKGKKHFQ